MMMSETFNSYEEGFEMYMNNIPMENSSTVIVSFLNQFRQSLGQKRLHKGGRDLVFESSQQWT